jgi:hypothetical protein
MNKITESGQGLVVFIIVAALIVGALCLASGADPLGDVFWAVFSCRVGC